MTIVLAAASAASGRSAPPPQRPHPAVVRVIAPERGGASYGSGALVAVNPTHGLVITNWHVVRQASGPIVVVFPDGFRSRAAVVKADRDWDLAALVIRRPAVEPIALAGEAPRRGEVLTIAGYGPGWYRAAAGRCIQYVSPGTNQPFEMVELSTAARNGDSGGPILNQRGELAGVLFGAAFGRTTGSYCGRVRWFLASVADEFPQSPSPATMLARRPPRDLAPVAAIGAVRPIHPPPSPPLSSDPTREPSARCELAELPAAPPQETPVAEISAPTELAASSEPPGSSRAEQIKTILAAIGVLAILFHGLRLISAAQK